MPPQDGDLSSADLIKLVGRDTLLGARCKCVRGRRATTLFNPTTSVLATFIGRSLLAVGSVVVALLGQSLIASTVLLASAVLLMHWALRSECVDLVRFSRRGMTLCSATLRKRRRRRLAADQLFSCEAAYGVIGGFKYVGPPDAVRLHVRVGLGVEPVLLCAGLKWNVDQLATTIDNEIKTRIAR